MMLLIVHLLLGIAVARFRLLSGRSDVKLLLRLNQMPDVSTVSRVLSSLDNLSIDRCERFAAMCHRAVNEERHLSNHPGL